MSVELHFQVVMVKMFLCGCSWVFIVFNTLQKRRRITSCVILFSSWESLLRKETRLGLPCRSYGHSFLYTQCPQTMTLIICTGIKLSLFLVFWHWCRNSASVHRCQLEMRDKVLGEEEKKNSFLLLCPAKEATAVSHLKDCAPTLAKNYRKLYSPKAEKQFQIRIRVGTDIHSSFFQAPLVIKAMSRDLSLIPMVDFWVMAS